MEEAMYAKCTYNGVTRMFFLEDKLKFVDVVDNVCSRFKLRKGCFGMTFSLPSYPLCDLACDSDFKLMMISMSQCNVSSIDITIREEGDCSSMSDLGVVAVRDCSSRPCSSTLSSIGNSETISLEANDYLGCFRIEAPRSYLTNEWGTYLSHVNQKFVGGVVEFRDKLKKYAVEIGFEFKYKRNHAEKIVATCAKRDEEGCMWSVSAKKTKGCDIFFISKLENNHTCKGVFRRQKSKHLGSSTIKSVISDNLKVNRSMKPKDIIATLKCSYGLDIPYHRAWYGKNVASASVRGGDRESYTRLPWYCAAVNSTNPGSRCVLQTNPISCRFERVFISFGGVINGFRSCLPLLFVDAAHLKHKFGGVMLCATGKNGNNEFYPLAYAIVDSENKANWTWFFEQLHHILTAQSRVITFFSDRNEGLLDSLAVVFPGSPHSYCYYHLRENVKKRYEKKRGDYDMPSIIFRFMCLAYSPTEKSYKYNLHKLNEVAGEPIKGLLSKLESEKEKWCNAYFKGNRCGEMSNSIAESFNNWTVELRELPIFDMMEQVRLKLMELMAERQAAANRWTSAMCPEVEGRLKELMSTGRHWAVSVSVVDTIFEVHAENSVTVDLASRTCSCRHWQINSFPCSHALLCMQRHNNVSIYEFLESYYTVQSYREAYAVGVSPIPNIEQLYDVAVTGLQVVLPPLCRVPSGRPRSVQLKSSVEGGKTRPVTCSRCKEVGRHNRATCKKALSGGLEE